MEQFKLKDSNLHYEIIDTNTTHVRIRIVETRAESDWIKKSELGIVDDTNMGTGSDLKEENCMQILRNAGYYDYTIDQVLPALAPNIGNIFLGLPRTDTLYYNLMKDEFIWLASDHKNFYAFRKNTQGIYEIVRTADINFLKVHVHVS